MRFDLRHFEEIGREPGVTVGNSRDSMAENPSDGSRFDFRSNKEDTWIVYKFVF